MWGLQLSLGSFWRIAGGSSVDLLAPPAPTLLDMIAASDSGPSSTDNETNDTTPTIDVTFAVIPLEDDGVLFYIDGVLFQTVVLTAGQATGVDTIPLTLDALTNGTYSLTAKHSRDGHIGVASSALVITINTHVPTVSTYFPADNATDVAANVTLVLTCSEAVALGAAGTVTLKKTSDNTTVDSWNVAVDAGSGAGQLEVLNDNEVNFHLTTNITSGFEVYGIWDAGFITDIAGNNIAAQASTTAWSFTVATTGYEAESETIFAAFTTPPNDTRKGVINTLVLALKTAGVWTKLDTFYVLGAADSQAALINWKNPGTFNATAVNAPTFTADQGFAGNGTTSYLDTGYTPSTNGSTFTQNSACLFVWSRTNTRSNSAAAIGAATSDAPAVAYINPWNLTVDNVGHGLNGSTGFNAFAPTSAAGFFLLTRTASTGYDVYRNTTNLGTQTSTSAGRSDQVMRICGGNVSANFTTRQILFAGCGGGLNSTEEAALYNALDAYRTAIGA